MSYQYGYQEPPINPKGFTPEQDAWLREAFRLLNFQLIKEFKKIQSLGDTVTTSVVTRVGGSGSSGGSGSVSSQSFLVSVSAGMNTIPFPSTMGTTSYTPNGIIYAADGSVAFPRFQVTTNSPEGDTRALGQVRCDCDVAGIMLVGLA